MQQADHDSALAADHLPLSERGQRAGEGSDWPTCEELAELLKLAERIRALPPVEPDRAWLEASRRRLLERFRARD